jgi:chemotaxis signal transduction protein
VSDERGALERRLGELKSAFDAAFATPAQSSRGAERAYLGIRLAGAPYALDLDEVAAVRKHVAVTPVPSDEPRLLGAAGFAGVLAAVYDLTVLLGQTRAAEPAWFVLVRGTPVVFAFDGLDGQLRVEADDAAAGPEVDASELIWRAGLTRPVIRLGAVLARLRGKTTDERREGTAAT